MCRIGYWHWIQIYGILYYYNVTLNLIVIKCLVRSVNYILYYLFIKSFLKRFT